MTGQELAKKYGKALIGAVVKDSFGVPLLVAEVNPYSMRAMTGAWVIDFEEAFPCVLSDETCHLVSLVTPHPHLLDRVAQARWARR